MPALLAETVNLLNEKGLRCKAIQKENGLALQFGLAVYIKGKLSKEIVEIFPKASQISIMIAGKERNVDVSGLESFVDKVLKLKALQEEVNKLVDELIA